MKSDTFLFLAAAGFIFFFSPDLYPGDNSKKPLVIIVDSENKEPLPGANFLLDNSKGQSTDKNGITILPDINSVYRFKVTYVGYKTVTGKIKVENGKADPDTIFLNPKPLRVGQVTVTTERDAWMSAGVSKPEELPSADMIRKMGSIFGNSIKSYEFLSSMNTSNGKTRYLGLDERSISQRINGIPVRDVFFSFYRPYFGENSKENLYVHPAPSEPYGILVLDSRTDFTRIKNFTLLASVDQARTQFSASGPINTFGTDENMVTKFDLSLDGNLSSLYGIDILKPKQWQGLGAIQTISGSDIFTFTGLFSLGNIELDYDYYKPFDYLNQKGLSLEWEKVMDKYSIELSYIYYNYDHTSGYRQFHIDKNNDRRYIPEKDGSLNSTVKSNELIFKFTDKWEKGFGTIGFDTRLETWRTSYLLPDLPNMFALRTAVFSDSLENKREKIAPGYAYMMANWSFNQNWNSEFGFIFAYDFLTNKGISPGPHFGINYTSDKKSFILDFLSSIRYMDRIYQSFNTQVSRYNYAIEERPLAWHSTFKIKFNDFLLKNSSLEFNTTYLSLMDQHKARLTEVPQDKFIDKQLGGVVISEEEAEKLRYMVSALSANPDAQSDMERTINLLSNRNQLLPYFNRMNYIVDNNKESVSFGVEFKWSDYLRASVNFSKTTYGSPFKPESIPAEDDIGIIAKINSLFYYFGKGKPKNLSTQISIVYYGGERYTPYYSEKSLAEKLKIEQNLDLLNQHLDARDISFLERETVRQGKRNSAQYPASIYTVLSLNYRFPVYSFRGGFGIFISDFHQLIPGVKKNVLKKQYDMEKDESGILKFVQKDAEGQGIFGGVNFFFEI